MAVDSAAIESVTTAFASGGADGRDFWDGVAALRRAGAAPLAETITLGSVLRCLAIGLMNISVKN